MARTAAAQFAVVDGGSIFSTRAANCKASGASLTAPSCQHSNRAADTGSCAVVVCNSVKQLVANDPWTVVQDGFDPEQHRVFESLFSLGNGHFGGRGNHEEQYSGDTLRGNYLAGIYYPDPTRVGWWKNGYPDSFAKVLNAPDWKALHIAVDGEPLDFATAEVTEYRRILHMKTGELERHARATLPNGRSVAIDSVRFVSMTRQHLGVIRYRITPLDGPAGITIESRVDGFVVEAPSAGGHIAPPRGRLLLDEEGEPIYGEKDVVDLDAVKTLGLPFWLAGGYDSPEKLRQALDAGAAGIQVGTAFAYCAESGMEETLKGRIVEKALAQ